MTRLVMLAGLVLALTGCGVDGPPIPPEPKPAKAGVVVSGTVKLGVAGGDG